MPSRKLYDSAAAAVADIHDGATVLLGGVSGANAPTALVSALADRNLRDLTCVCDSTYYGAEALHRLVAAGCVSSIVSPAPFGPGSEDIVQNLWRSGDLTVEVVPWGTLAERMRSAGAGIGGVFLPVGIGTRFAEGKEIRVINGVECVFETPLRGDFALIRALRADSVGNLVYAGAQRGWNSAVVSAARVAIAEVDQVVEAGSIDPERVITPGIFVNRIARASSAPIG
jgi:3-oxoadipate CoA-transferase alpha subunit